ncbi:urease accessory protein UreE [Sinimarinibacterium flocculans]|uniref:urease accessory protein UreE n=1 Tax=Sinimarinibacterium flocculans TaxID=985250 RepID=UPI002491A481|nr:urease accessory protein UreE [Sinimarinibacterium flocculans]
MLRLTTVADARDVRCAPRELVLSFAERSRSRLRSVLDDGTDVGVLLPRGTVLRGGDLLRAETGEVVRVRAAIEPLYRVTACEDDADPRFSLLRAAYHLGNRHVPLMLAPQALHLEQDPVLREMLQRLGLIVAECVAPFEPESGAYGGGHRHDHDAQGGSLGEQLSREAHARRAVDLSTLQFHR